MAETSKTLGLNKDIPKEDLLKLLMAANGDKEGPDTEALKQYLKQTYGEQNPMNLTKDAPWWEFALHHANDAQRVVFNPLYNKLQEEDAKREYFKEAATTLMPNWDTLPQEKKNEWYKRAFNAQVERQNTQRDVGMQTFKEKNDKELTQKATQKLVDEWNKTPDVKRPAQGSKEFNDALAIAKEQVANEMFGAPKEGLTGNYDMRVGTLTGKVNARDFIERFGKPELFSNPEILREMMVAPPSTVVDLVADPLAAAGKLVQGGKAVAHAAGIVDDASLLKVTRKIAQTGNIQDTLAKLPDSATLINDVRSQNPNAIKNFAASIGKTPEQLDANDIKQFIMKDAQDFAKRPLQVAKEKAGSLVSTTMNNLRETPNANRSDLPARIQRVGAGLTRGVEKIERALVYDGIGQQGIRTLQRLDPNMTEQNARDLFNKLREIRQDRAAVSQGAVAQAKNLGKGTLFENFYRLPAEQQDELYNALETYYQKGGAPANFSTAGADMSQEALAAASKLDPKSGEVFDKYRNTIDDFTKRTLEPRTLASGEQIGGPMGEEHLIDNYLPHTHTDYVERLTRTYQGTAREIEALNGRKEVAGLLGDKKLIPNELRPGFELYAGDFKQSKITGKASGDIGYTDARTVSQNTPTLKDIANRWEMARQENVDMETFLNSVFPNGTSKHTLKEYAEMLNDPVKVEKMKQTPYSFAQLDAMVPELASKSGVDVEKIMARNVGEYSRDIPLASARALQRMADRNFMLDSLVELNKAHGDEAVMFVPRKGKNVKIPEGYVKYSDNTFVSTGSGKAKESTPTLLSTTHDIYMRPELVDMLNNYKRNYAAQPGLLNFFAKKALNVFGATKASMTSFKPSGLGFVAGNAVSSSIQTMAMAKSVDEYAETAYKAMNGILGKGDDAVRSPFGKYTSKQIYEEAVRRGVIQPSTPESFKVMQALAEEMKTSTWKDPAGSLRNVNKMKPLDAAKEVGEGALRQLSPSSSTWSKSMRAMSDAFETVNRTQAMMMFVERGMPLDMAAAAVKKIYVDYQALAPGTRIISKTAVPFVTFTKTMAQNVLNNLPMMAKINMAAEGYDRSKPTMGGEPDAVMREAQKDPMGIWVNKNQQFSPSRFVMGSGVFGISPDPQEANYGVSPVVNAMITAGTGVKNSMSPSGKMNIENRDAQFLGKKFKKGDTLLGVHPGKLIEFAKLEPHLQFVDQLMQFMPKDAKKEDMYAKAKPWYNAVIPRLRDINSGFNMLINENYQEGVALNKLKESQDIALGTKGVERTMQDTLKMKIKDKQGSEKEIERTQAPEATKQKYKEDSEKMYSTMYKMADKSMRMVVLANAVKVRLMKDNTIPAQRRAEMIDKAEELEKSWGTKLLTIKDTYLTPYLELRMRAGLPMPDIGGTNK